MEFDPTAQRKIKESTFNKIKAFGILVDEELWTNTADLDITLDEISSTSVRLEDIQTGNIVVSRQPPFDSESLEIYRFSGRYKATGRYIFEPLDNDKETLYLKKFMIKTEIFSIVEDHTLAVQLGHPELTIPTQI